MANTLTNLIADLYVALDVVSREQVGFIPAVTRDAQVDRAALNQVVRSFVAPAAAASDLTPAVTPPDDGDQNIGNTSITINKSRRVPLRWNGEQSLAVNNNGPGQMTIKQAQLAQAIRTLTNEIETDLGALAVYGSRAYGATNVYPFATNLADSAQARKILSDNGAPMADLHGVINTTAGANLRTLAQLTKANEAGTDSILRQGVLIDLHGFAMRESAKVFTPASVGNNTGTYAVNGAHADGATSISIKTGTGTLLAGDIITFGSNPEKYVVKTGVNNGTTVVIQEPGLQTALAGNEAVAVIAACPRNVYFERSAIVLATRLPALPQEGDSAVDRTTIVDPRSGLTFEVSMYAQYRQMQYELSCAWGCAAIKPEHIALNISQI